MSSALVRSTRSIAWELRTAWATGRRVALNIDGETSRVEGWVTQVSATDAFVIVADAHVPLSRVLAVHHPSRLGDSTVEGEQWAGPPLRLTPQIEQLWSSDEFDA